MKGGLVWVRIESDGSKMLLDHSLHRIKPQSQSFTERLCCKERLEHAIRTLRRDSVTGIRHLDQDRLSLQFGGQGEGAGTIHRIERVFYERGPSLVQLAPEGFEQRYVRT